MSIGCICKLFRGGVSVLYSGMYVYYIAKFIGRPPPTYIVHNTIQQRDNTTQTPPQIRSVIAVYYQEFPSPQVVQHVGRLPYTALHILSYISPDFKYTSILEE